MLTKRPLINSKQRRGSVNKSLSINAPSDAIYSHLTCLFLPFVAIIKAMEIQKI